MIDSIYEHNILVEDTEFEKKYEDITFNYLLNENVVAEFIRTGKYPDIIGDNELSRIMYISMVDSIISRQIDLLEKYFFHLISLITENYTQYSNYYKLMYYCNMVTSRDSIELNKVIYTDIQIDGAWDHAINQARFYFKEIVNYKKPEWINESNIFVEDDEDGITKYKMFNRIYKELILPCKIKYDIF